MPGGGRLVLFHWKLAIAQNILGGEVLAAMGESRNDLKRVPIGKDVHDFRDFAKQAMTAEQAANLKWAEVNSDWAYTALLRIGDPAGVSTARFRRRFDIRPDVGIWRLHGLLWAKETLHVDGTYMQGPMYLRTDGSTWEELAIPLSIHATKPARRTKITRVAWNQLARAIRRRHSGQAASALSRSVTVEIYRSDPDTIDWRMRAGWRCRAVVVQEVQRGRCARAFGPRSGCHSPL